MITIIALYIFTITPAANAEINQEYNFFPIGTWLIPPCHYVSTTGVNPDTFNAPPLSCYSMFDDFKLDWVRFALSFTGTRNAFWTDNNNNNKPDEYECDIKCLTSFAPTGVRAQMNTRSITNKIHAFWMNNEDNEIPIDQLPKMRYPTGVLEGEGVSLWPLRYGPDGAFQYFHPFKNNHLDPLYPDYYDDEYPEYETLNHNVHSNDQYNYDSFYHHTVTLYDGVGGHGLENPYSYFTRIAPKNLYYFAAEHEIRDHNFSYTREAYKVYADRMAYYGDLNDNLYPPRFSSFASDETGAETRVPYWVREQQVPGHQGEVPNHDEFANQPDGIDNHFRWYLSWVNDDVLFGRATYPFRWDMPVNSEKIYIGRPKADIDKWYYNPMGFWESVTFPGVKEKGFHQVYYNLNRLREASRIYQIPVWHCPQVQQEYGNGAARHPTPREARSQVNLALTYGIKGIVYFRLYTTLKNFPSQGPPYERGVTYYDIDGTSYGKKHGQPRTDDYEVTISVGGTQLPNEDIPYPDLINEVIAVNTKLDKLRHTIYTLDNHASVWLGEETNPLPAHFIKGYSHNRVSSVPTNDPNSPEANHGYLDIGTGTDYNCIDVGAFTDYDGVRYFAVSDRFNNWVPDDYEDGTYDNPTGTDGVSLYAPGNKIRGVYNEYYDGGSTAVYEEVIDRSGFVNGSCSYQFGLGNADGRFFEVMPNLTDNWSFEDDKDHDGMPDGWTVTLVSNENRH